MKEVTSQHLIDRTKNKIGNSGKDPFTDVINICNEEDLVTDKVLTSTLSLERMKSSAVSWLRFFIAEIPTKWISTNESSWIPWHM